MLEARALVPDADHAVAQLGAHRPGAGQRKAGAQHSFQKGFPASAVGAAVFFGVALLEGVVDGDRKGRVRLRARLCMAAVMPSRKNTSACLLAAVAVGRGNQFFGLGHGQRGVQLGEDRPQAAAQPDVEEVGQVGVADVVVVRRVGGNDLVLAADLWDWASHWRAMPPAEAGNAIAP
jgi:hypothetical protein